MIEYILVLTLTVAIVAAISRGVGRPMGEYIQNNVLNLVGCMLRVGQFPTKSFGLCQGAIQAQLDVNGGFANGSNSGSNGSNSSKISDSSSTAQNQGNSDDNGENGSNENSSDSSSSRTRIRSRNQTGSLDESGGDSAFESGTTKRVKLNVEDTSNDGKELKGPGGQNFGETTVIVRRIKRDEGRVGGSFLIQGNQEDSDYEGVGPEKYTATQTQKAPVNEFNVQATNRRLTIPIPKDTDGRKPAAEVKVGFSFIGMIKWIIIGAVLFFIIVFAASQLNSIRKGWTD